MVNSSRRGSEFERMFAKKLSLWWSHGQHEDWFWRSSSSGARATTRAKTGRSTANGYGDICAQCKQAQGLLDVVTFELKRGYNDVTLSDLIEKPDNPGKLLEFMKQSALAASLAGTPGWVLVHKRDRREAIYYTYLEDAKVDIPLTCITQVWAVGIGVLGVLSEEEFFSDQMLSQLEHEARKIAGKQ